MTDKDFLLSSEQLKTQMRQEIDRLFDVIEPLTATNDHPHHARISQLIEESVASMVVGDQTIMREWLEKLRGEK